MKETDLLSEIDYVVRSADGLPSALRKVQALIANEYGGAPLIIRPAASGDAPPATASICQFLESREFSFRGFYTTRLDSGNRPAGTLIACIGTWGAPADLLRRVTNYAGQKLAELAGRLRLSVLEYAEAA